MIKRSYVTITLDRAEAFAFLADAEDAGRDDGSSMIGFLADMVSRAISDDDRQEYRRQREALLSLAARGVEHASA